MTDECIAQLPSRWDWMRISSVFNTRYKPLQSRSYI